MKKRALFRRPGSRPLQPVALLLALVGGAACSDASDSRCEQTYEFGNYGCADVVGRLVDRNDEPLGGVEYGVVNRERELESRFNTNVIPATPDSLGNFRLRITRYLLIGPPTTPDTGSVWLIGSMRPPFPGPDPGIRDSVLVTLQFAPIGGVPEPSPVTIRLPLP
jgi:hypothetical protein